MSGAPRVLAVRDDWNRLVGGIVEIRLNGHLVRTGKVDQATPDSSMLWIAPDAVEPRTLFAKSAGYKVRPAVSRQ